MAKRGPGGGVVVRSFMEEIHLDQALARLDKAREELDDALFERDDAIRDALAMGATWLETEEAAGLTRHQIGLRLQKLAQLESESA